MNKNAAIAILLVILAGCQFVPAEKKDLKQLPEVNIGTQGVELSFGAGTPPAEVYEENPFTLLVVMSNLGTTDVDQGVYTLSYEKQSLYIPREQHLQGFRVRGKSIFNPQGEERTLNFVFSTKPLGPQIERYPASIAFTACYPYQTRAPLTVCVDTDILNKRKDKVCTPRMQMLPAGQGAPVAVASVEPRMLPGENQNTIRPEFVITLRNQGSGEVVAANTYREACSGRPLGDEAWNIISVEAMLSEIPLTCTPSPAKLRQQGETRVVCTLEGGISTAMGTYTAPFTVLLDYGYTSRITTQVNIVKP